MSNFALPQQRQIAPGQETTFKDLRQMRRALLLEMFGGLKWFGEIEATDAPMLAEQIRRRKRRAT